MGRKRRGQPINGWVIIDKPLGMSSAAVVNRVREAFDAAKAGHGGTLDPLATGVLPVAMGEATKTVSYAMEGTKVYRFTVHWGEARATDDAEGAVVATSDHRPDSAAIEAVLAEFEGDISQTPPVYSAIKVSGRRAYDLARADEPVTLEPRMIHIDQLRLVAVPDVDHAEFEVRSGKGAYMRSLARDIAARLGTVGYISALRRTVVGPFSEDVAISLDKLSDVGHSDALADHLLPVEAALDGIPALTLTEVEARRISSGQPISVLPVASRSPFKGIRQGDVVSVMAGGRLLALAQISGGEIRPVRVLNL